MEVTEDDEGSCVDVHAGSSVDVPFDPLYGQGIRNSRINLLIVHTRAELAKISRDLRNENYTDLDNSYRRVNMFKPLKTLPCNGLVYHVYEDTLKMSMYVTRGLFFCNTIIMVCSGRDVSGVGECLELQQQLLALADYMKQCIRIIITISDMYYEGTWDEASYNDLKANIIKDLPLLNNFNVTWIPLPLRAYAHINIFGKNQLVPWYKGQTFGECLCRLPEERYQLHKFMTLNDTNLPCRFSVLNSKKIRGFPHLLRVTGQVMAGTIRKDKSYTFMSSELLVLVKVVLMTSGDVNISNGYPGDVLKLIIYSESRETLHKVDSISGSLISDSEQLCPFATLLRAEISVLVRFIPGADLFLETSGFKSKASLKSSPDKLVTSAEKGDRLNIIINSTYAIPTEVHLGRTTWGLFVLKKETSEKQKPLVDKANLQFRLKEFEEVVAVGKIID